VCVSSQTDNANCGSCNNVCAAGTWCAMGTCQGPDAGSDDAGGGD
jgi:hypothetical protein